MKRLHLLLLIVLPLLVFGRVLGNDFLAIDDQLLIVNNVTVHAFTFANLKTIFTTYDPELYVPVTLLTYMIEYSIFGPNPVVFHATNVVLHIANGLLVFAILRRWIDVRVALLCALLFSVHPLQTEAIAWASGRKDLLSASFFLLSVFSYDLWLERAGWLRALSLISFALGLMAKISIIGLPLFLVALEWARGRPLRSALLRQWPYFLLATLFGIIALFGKAEAPFPGVITFFLLSVHSMAWTLWHIVFPLQLNILPLAPAPISLFTWQYLLSVFFGGGILIALFLARRLRMVIVGAVLFFIALAPSFFNLTKADAFYSGSDRYAYLALIGILLVVGYFGQRLLQWRPFYAVVFVLLMAMGGLSFAQAGLWQNDVLLFEHALALAPRSHVALIDLANAYRERGNTEDAKGLYQRALAIGSFPQAHYNLGLLYEGLGQLEAARESYEQAIQSNPTFVLAYINLGTILYKQGNRTEAKELFERAEPLAPFVARIPFNLGVLATEEGKASDAIAAYHRALKADPRFVDAYVNLSLLYFQMGNREKALEYFEAAASIDPLHPHVLALEKIIGKK